MKIKIVTGTAGSGKTQYARRRAAELALAGQRTALLVPEQFSFETERAMLELLEPSHADSVEVFSFTRLADKIARQVGGLAGRRLDECGRAAVMSVAMSQVQDHLTLYAGGRKGQELIANLLAAVGEFKSCAISPELLAETAKQVEESVLSQKLRELSLIYGAYNACIANIGSIDPLDDLSRLAKHLEEWDYFADTTVIVDSFTGFTRQEWLVLEQIATQCGEMEITLCCDDARGRKGGARTTEKKLDLFTSVYQTVDALRELTEQRQGSLTFRHLDGHPRFANEAMQRVEAGIFRTAATQTYPDATEELTVYAAADKYDEAEFTAREIRRLVREEHMRWRDFAVICRTASDYQAPMLRALEMQGIPYFCDRRAVITDLPLVRFVLAALEIVAGRWRTEDIMRWLKTGMLTDVSYVDAARLENYCFLWGISGSKKWKSEFTLSPYGYSDREQEGEAAVLAQINASRECIVNLLDRFEKCMKDENATGRDMAAAVYELIDGAGAAKCIERMLPKLSPADADAQGQVWQSLMNVLDQLADILAAVKVSFREFTELFTLMVGLCDVGHIPQGMDEVVFGAANRIRTPDVKAVFVVGVNDGVFPLTPLQSGLLTDNERKLLIRMKLPLSGDQEDSAVSEQFLAYHAMTCASEKLYVTYAKLCNGETLYSSDAVSELLRTVPNCCQMTKSSELTLDMIEHVEAGFLLAAGQMGEHSELAASLVQCYADRSEYADKIAVVRSANTKSEYALHNKEQIYSLFGRNIRVSASKAESFYNCRFQYFCKYGMKVPPRRRAELNPLEYGSVVHYVLEQLLKENDIGQLVNDERLNDKIKECLRRYLDEVMGGVEMKSARFLYLFRRLVGTLTVLVVQLGEEFAKSLFTPEAFELPIDGTQVQPLSLPLSDGTKIVVGGKIDRVDVFRKDGVRYLRVVDYKTGSKEFVLSDILSGLNMQMLIYLDILCDRALAAEDNSPAGVIYSPASLKKVAGVRGETSYDKERQEMLKKNGLIVDDSDVINAMEIGMEKKVDKKANASVKGATTFLSSTYVANPTQFAEIRGYMRGLLREMGEALHRGEIQAMPAKGTYDACAYCDYRVMCSQERKNTGREIRKKSMTETMALIEKATPESERQGGEEKHE